MPQHNRSLSPWSLLILTALLAGGLWLWSRSQRTPPPATEQTESNESEAPANSSRSLTTGASESGVQSSSPAVAPENGSQIPLLAGVRFEPSEPVTGSQLTAIPEIKLPEDLEVSRHFKWWLNGSEVQDSDENCLKADLERDDEVVVEATIEIAPDSVQTVRERVVVGNAGPKIDSIEHHLSGNEYRALIKVTDPEGDDVHFECKTCPTGMKLVINTLRWDVSEAQGTYPVEVSVHDSYGDGSIASFSITVSNREGLHVVVQ
jgi:hypothetical protein